jgi:hypothetical protein
MSLRTGPTAQARQQAAREGAGKKAEPKGLTAPRFKSTKEAEQWVKDNELVSGQAFFKGFDLRVAQDTCDSLAENINRIPQLKGQIKWMGNNREVSKLKRAEARPVLEERWRKYSQDERTLQRVVSGQLNKRPYTIRMAPNAYAMAVGKQDFYMSFKWAKNRDNLESSLRRDVQQGWHPKGTATAKAVVDHEIAHVLEGTLRLRNDPVLTTARRNAQINKSWPSQYARQNFSEFVAESWSEFLNSPTPSESARRVGARIEELSRGR